MKEKIYRRPLFRAAAFLLGLLLLLALAGNLLRPKNNTLEAGMYDADAMGFLAEPKDSLDAVFLGDSLTYAGISPMEIWDEYGIPTYVCGSTKQRSFQGYAILKQFLACQSPQVVVLEPHTLYQPVSLSSALAREVYPFLPVLEYHDRWKELTAADLFQTPEYTYVTIQKGYKFRSQAQSASGELYMLPTQEAEEISPLNRLYFHRMVSLCREKGVQLVLVSVPSEADWDYGKHNAIQALAQSYGLSYVDLNLMTGEVPINWETDTRDKGDHLNYYGAKKVSHWLGGYLEDNYPLTDKRQDPAYEMWHTQWEIYQKLTKKAQAKGLD